MITFIFVWLLLGLCLGLTIVFIDYLNHCTIDRMYIGLMVVCIALGGIIIPTLIIYYIGDKFEYVLGHIITSLQGKR